MSDDQPKIRKAPVKRGGARYPKYKLEDALGWSSKLVSRTHATPQPEEVIFAAVVTARGSTGDIKIAALKQYGLMEGSSTGYSATELARKVAAAPEEDSAPLIADAALSPPVFKQLYDTFAPGEATRGRLKQRTSDLKVHPDNADECVDIYISALTTAGLARAEGDKLIHVALNEISASRNAEEEAVEAADTKPGQNSSTESVAEIDDAPVVATRGRSAVTVTVNVDSTMDPDKLEKQLALLKRYGAL